NGIDVVGFTACAPVGRYAMHFVVGDEGTVDALCDATAGRQEEHVTVSEQLFRATLTEDGARVDLRLHHEGQTRGNVGLDEAGEYVHRRTLGSEHEVDAGGTRLLRDTRDQLLDLLAHHHHHVGEFVDHHYDQWQFLEWRPLLVFLGQHRIGLPQ